MQIPQPPIIIHLHEQVVPIPRPPLLLLHPLEPQHPLPRHPFNLILHLVIQAESQILLKPVRQRQGYHQRQRDH